MRSASTLALGALFLGAYEGCSSSTPSDAPDSGAPAVTDAGLKDTSLPPGDDDATPPDASVADTAVDDAVADVDVPDSAFDCSADGGPNTLPDDLRCTGLYGDWTSKTIATSIRPYTPGYVLWSDGALKSRFIYLPPGSQIDTTDMDDWVFPVGTKLFKEFRLGTQRIETRLFQKVALAPATPTWIWTTYRWAADESTATKLENGEQDVNNTTYEVPSHNQCAQCHRGRKDFVLGFDAISLGASGAAGVTLSSLAAQGWLTTAPPASLVIPEDASGHARPALGWLHANCGSSCHNANPDALATGTGLFLKVSASQIIAGNGTTRTEDLAPYTTSVNVYSNMQPVTGKVFMRIKPGDDTLSLIPLLDSSRNVPGIPQMPPIISHMVDTADVDLVKTWIDTMPIPDSGVVDAGAPTDAQSGGG